MNFLEIIDYPYRILLKDTILEELNKIHPNYKDNSELMRIVETKMRVSPEDRELGREFLGYTGETSPVFALLKDMHMAEVIDVIGIGNGAKSAITDKGMNILENGGYKKLFENEVFSLNSPKRDKKATVRANLALFISILALILPFCCK